MQAEGKTEEQALSPDRPPAQTEPNIHHADQLGKVAGTEHREPAPAAPHVRRLAREIGVDIYDVKGSGPGRTHQRRRCQTAREKSAGDRCHCSASTSRRTTLSQPDLPRLHEVGKVERVSMRGVRRKTAQHLWEAWNTIPHVTQQDKADITELEQLRARFAPKAEEAGGKMTVDCNRAQGRGFGHQGLPAVQRPHRHGEGRDRLQAVHQHRRRGGYRSRPAGAGHSHDVDKKNIVELAAELTQLSKKARDKKLTPEEMERRHLHDHQSRRHWRHRIFAHRQLSGSRDSRPFALQHGAGLDERQIRSRAKFYRYHFLMIIG